MNRVSFADYKSMLPYIDRTACGAVYPLSIAETVQQGEIYFDGNSNGNSDGISVLFWHNCGFAFLYGACDDGFLNCVYETFLCAGNTTSRRFILFATNERVRRFFLRQDNIVTGKRYFFEYPDRFTVTERPLPDGFQLRGISGEVFDQAQGRVTPRFSWTDSSAFLKNGKGCCILDGNTPAAWAFSAAVSTEEIDIGVETRPEYRRLGLGTIAAGRMVRYCLEQRKRPVWACNGENTPSRKLAETLGFVKTAECVTCRQKSTGAV